MIKNITDISTLQESSEVECKLAQGRDGLGTLPKDMWATYSAFANTGGGDIFLGIKEDSYLKVVEFDHFRLQAGLLSFVLSPGQWVEKTNAFGLFTKARGK